MAISSIGHRRSKGDLARRGWGIEYAVVLTLLALPGEDAASNDESKEKGRSEKRTDDNACDGSSRQP